MGVRGKIKNKMREKKKEFVMHTSFLNPKGRDKYAFKGFLFYLFALFSY